MDHQRIKVSCQFNIPKQNTKREENWEKEHRSGKENQLDTRLPFEQFTRFLCVNSSLHLP